MTLSLLRGQWHRTALREENVVGEIASHNERFDPLVEPVNLRSELRRNRSSGVQNCSPPAHELAKCCSAKSIDVKDRSSRVFVVGGRKFQSEIANLSEENCSTSNSKRGTL